MLLVRFLCILLFLLLLLLFFPVTIKIAYSDTVTLSVGAFGLYFRLIPKKKKPVSLRAFRPAAYAKLLSKEQRKAQKNAEAKANKAAKKKDAKDAKKLSRNKKLPPAEVSDETSMITILLRTVGHVLNTFFGRLYIRVLRLRIVVGGDDATKTALTYGVISQGIAYLLELLSEKTNFKRAKSVETEIVADFFTPKTTADILLLFRLRLIDLAATGLVFLIRFLKEKLKDNPQKRSTASLKKRGAL